eukprot:TRINITY_DN2815_c0_g2_i1.p1 TRINITY_DN2815_c0_g2~~TRINITY_DN2815_c0_g2_i1.p1  ORF type:complete len:156 (+),score=17.14 TRINITY_DN2815_c0_g2_i1:51-518(+)
MNSHWHRDEQVTHCGLCNQLFSAAVRKHHCRLCGEIFCEKCSSRQITYPELNITDERGCASCYDFLAKHRPYLISGVDFVLYTFDTKQGVTVSLSPDDQFLTVTFKGNVKLPFKVELSKLVSFCEGQTTDVWKSHTTTCFCFPNTELQRGVFFLS